jgi:hypothetical protein
MTTTSNEVEYHKILKEAREERSLHEAEKIKSKLSVRNKFVSEKRNILEAAEERSHLHGRLLEAARDDALATTIKAIYITALEANTLTDSNIVLAEDLVDSWIKQRGGASVILGECKNKTYLLNRLAAIVEDNAQEEVKDIEKDEDAEDDSKKEESKEDTSEDKDDSESKKDEDEFKDNSKEDSSDNKEDDDEEDEDDDSEKDSNNEEKKDDDNPLKDVVLDDDNEDTSDSKDIKGDNLESDEPLNNADGEDDGETDTADDIIGDVKEPELTVDGNEENQGKIFDDLDKEEDVQKAVSLIRQRVADAEETFIKNNTEDKKQIDELLGKISDNIKTVEKMDQNDNKTEEEQEQSDIAEESARINRQKIKNITDNRPLTVFEKVTRNLTESVMKDQSLLESYTAEGGEFDTSTMVQSAKVMYGFMETLNTLQLEKVDSKYIENVLEEMLPN